MNQGLLINTSLLVVKSVNMFVHRFGLMQLPRSSSLSDPALVYC